MRTPAPLRTGWAWRIVLLVLLAEVIAAAVLIAGRNDDDLGLTWHVEKGCGIEPTYVTFNPDRNDPDGKTVYFHSTKIGSEGMGVIRDDQILCPTPSGRPNSDP